MNGFLLINKSQGMTSHDVVAKIKKKFHIDKVGHTGTLDPFASGLLILCLGKATKLAHLFSNLDKAYAGVMRFGVHYDTYDYTGTLLKTSDTIISQNDIEKEMKKMIGTYEQLPPMFSAIKVNGRKLYDLAREGKDIERETRSVEIQQFHLTKKIDDMRYEFFTSVSKGTYIRSLAVDLATKLNTYATLEALTRLSVGKYELNQAKTIEEVTNNDMITVETYFKDFERVILNDYMIRLVKNGVYLDERQIITDHPFVVYDQNNQMIAYYEVIGKLKYKPILIF